MLVVADASPLILLGRLGLLDLLHQLYDRVVAPRAVLDEVLGDGGDLPGSSAVREAAWLEIVDVSHEDSLWTSLQAEVDMGEAAAVALAKQLEADLLLIDERQGRRLAQQLGLKVRGTLGILVSARREGLLEKLRPILNRLVEEGAWLKPTLVRSVLEAVGEDADEGEEPESVST